MQPHQQRVVDEKAELDDKITKLKAFTEGGVFQSLDKLDKDLLESQLVVMVPYSAILSQRIGRF